MTKFEKIVTLFPLNLLLHYFLCYLPTFLQLSHCYFCYIVTSVALLPRLHYYVCYFCYIFASIKLFLNGPTPVSFSFIFSLFNKHEIFTTNQCEKCPSILQHRDSNLQPSDYEYPPLTTRPGLHCNFCYIVTFATL